MLTLTENATRAIEGILSDPDVPDGAGIRIAAGSPADVSGDSERASLDLALAQAPAEDDQVIDEPGVRVFVDRPIAEFLDDKLLDAQMTEREVSFMIGARPQ